MRGGGLFGRGAQQDVRLEEDRLAADVRETGQLAGLGVRGRDGLGLVIVLADEGDDGAHARHRTRNAGFPGIGIQTRAPPGRILRRTIHNDDEDRKAERRHRTKRTRFVDVTSEGTMPEP